MSKRKKKRNKIYRGRDSATPSEPTIRRYSAVDRGKFGQWWFEKKRFIKIVSSIAVVVTVVVWLIIVLFQTLSS